MKRKISVVLLLFSAFACLFADNFKDNSTDNFAEELTEAVEAEISSNEKKNNSLVFIVTPYGRQFVSTSLNTKHKSDYGFGFSLGYRRSFLESFVVKLFVGGDIAYKAYTYSKDRTPDTHLGNLQFLAKVGCAFNLSQNFGLTVNTDLGMEIDFSRLATNVKFVNGIEINTTYKLTQRYTALTGLELSSTIPKSKDSEYRANALNLNLLLGVQMNF